MVKTWKSYLPCAFLSSTHIRNMIHRVVILVQSVQSSVTLLLKFSLLAYSQLVKVKKSQSQKWTNITLKRKWTHKRKRLEDKEQPTCKKYEEHCQIYSYQGTKN